MATIGLWHCEVCALDVTPELNLKSVFCFFNSCLLLLCRFCIRSARRVLGGRRSHYDDARLKLTGLWFFCSLYFVTLCRRRSEGIRQEGEAYKRIKRSYRALDCIYLCCLSLKGRL